MLTRFKRRDTPFGLDCGEADTVDHTIFLCTRWTRERLELGTEVGENVEPENLVQTMLTTESNWKAVAKYARTVLTIKDKKDSARLLPSAE